MIAASQFAELLGLAVQDLDLDDVLSRLAHHALNLTLSDHAVIALLDEDEGVLQVMQGAGADWMPSRVGETYPIVVADGGGLIASVAASKKSVKVDDVSQDPRYLEMYPGSMSEIAVPVFDRMRRIRGVLNLESNSKDHYTTAEQQVSEGIAALIGVFVMREDRRKREEALIQVGSVLDRSDKREDLIERVLEVTDTVLELHSCSIFLYDRARDLYVLAGTEGALKSKIGEVGYAADEGCTGWVCVHGEALMIHEPQSDPRWKGRFIEFPTEQVASYLCVPIMRRKRCIGALRVMRKKSENPYLDNRFTEDDQRLLVAIAEQFASGLENIRFFESALQVERMAAWGEMSAKSSHMIGNRVFAIKGDVNELGYLIKEPELSREALSELETSLKTNVTRIEEILQDFRDYVSAAQVSLVRADINFLVQEAVREVFPRRTKVRINWKLQPDLPEVNADGNRLRRAVGEIVENSLSFHDTGEFTVETCMADAEMIRLAKLPQQLEYVQLTFSDQGPGVSAENKDAIFQPFFSTRSKGMGLGLSIVRGILEAHGGTAMELGEEGSGAKFVLLLPGTNRP